jgi:hypothetical protein
MKNIKSLMAFVALVGVSVASAYYDQYGNWHEDVITEALDSVTGGRYSDQPQDTQARKEASRQLEDTKRKTGQKAEDKKRDAQRKYQDKQQKIQRKKEDRRRKNQ